MGPYRKSQVISFLLGVSLFAGCSVDALRYAPRTEKLSADLRTITKKFPFEVGFYISPPDRQLTVKIQRTPAILLTYMPYRDLEDGLRIVLETLFRGARPVEQDPAAGISAPGLLAVLTPKIKTEDLFLPCCWTPDTVTVSLNSRIYDSTGKLIWATEVQGKGKYEEGLMDRRGVEGTVGAGSAGRKAFEQALVALARAIASSKELELWARNVSPEYVAMVGTPPAVERPPQIGPSGAETAQLASRKTELGRYHALVIGNEAYRHITSLKTPVADAKAVAEVLRLEYGFHVELLTNATRTEIIRALDDLRRTLSEDDNLLIYYAGHGYLDKDVDRGYWLPVDAETDNTANWLPNTDITDKLRGLRAKHVLVVADSCYSGTLVRDVAIKPLSRPDLQRLAHKRARTVLTSGGLEPVLDVGGGTHSVFARAFITALQNVERIADTTSLFATVRREVLLRAEQTPQYSDIRQAGHEGGDFLFVRRR